MGGLGCGIHRAFTAGCLDCRRNSSAYERRRRKRLGNGTWQPSVPAAEVLAHINVLKSQGMSVAAIARAAGVSEPAVRAAPRREFYQGPTAAAILSVTSQPTPSRSPRQGEVPSFRVARRLQALMATGWSLREQGRRLGMDPTQVWQLCQAKTAHVTEENAARVVALFDELWDQDGGSVRARNNARRKGWPPPLAWDDIDDSSAVPVQAEAGESADDVDEVVVERVLAGERLSLNDAELIATLQTCVARRESLSTLALRLGLNYAVAKRLSEGELTPAMAKRAAKRTGSLIAS